MKLSEELGSSISFLYASPAAVKLLPKYRSRPDANSTPSPTNLALVACNPAGLIGPIDLVSHSKAYLNK